MNLKPNLLKVILTTISAPFFFYICIKLGTILNFVETRTICQSSVNGQCGIVYTNGYIALLPALLLSILFYLLYSYFDKK